MTVFLQDTAQLQRDTSKRDNAQRDTAQRDTSATTATTAMPMPEMRTPENVGYLQAVYVEVVLIFGGYLWLQYRRNVQLRQRQDRFGRGR